MEGVVFANTVRHYAPDAIVLINRQYAVPAGCTDCNCTKSIKEDITNISINVGVNQAPSVASFTIVTPQSSPINYHDRGYFRLQPMQEVNIYIKGRFPLQAEGGDVGDVGNIDEINSPYPYYHSFWGVTSSVRKTEDANGNDVLNVECADMLRFWEMTEVLTSPALTNVLKIGADISVPFVTIFHGKSIPSIIYELAKNIYPSMFIGDGLRAGILGADAANLRNLNKSTQEYWQERFKTIASAIRIFGFTGTIQTVDDLANKSNLGTNAAFNNRERTYLRITSDEKEGQGKFDERLFSQVRPFFNSELKNPVLTQSDKDNMLSIAKNLVEIHNWEFYQDVTGEIILKPPFYNVEVKDYAPHVIEPIEILNEEHLSDEKDIPTSVEIRGTMGALVKNSEFDAYGRFTNFHLTQQLGFRVVSKSVPYLTDSHDCYLYAQDLLSRLVADNLYTASMTIVGRPEIRPGYPVYLPHKDMYYYVVGVSHSFVWGESFTTNLTLRAGRRRLYSLPINGNEDYERGLNFSEPKRNFYLAHISRKVGQISKDKEQQVSLGSQNGLKQYTAGFVTEHGIWNYIDADALIKEKPDFKLTDISNNIKGTTEVVQVSDAEGYELVGTLPYGRFLTVRSTGQIDMNQTLKDQLDGKKTQNNLKSASLNSNERAQTFMSIVDKAGKDPSEQTVPRSVNRTVSPTDEQALVKPDTTKINQHLHIASLAPDGLTNECVCDCHYEDTQTALDAIKYLERTSKDNPQNVEKLRNITKNIRRFGV